MKQFRYGLPCAALVALMCGMAVFGGCSYTVMPRSIPSLKDASSSLTGASLIVTSAEKDATTYAIRTDTGDSSALRANRQAWSNMLVETLAGELAKRGARISSRAPLMLGLALPEIIFAQQNKLYQIRVKVLVSSSSGWQKNFEGSAESGAYGFESTVSLMNRLAGLALAQSVKAMLSDEDFLTQVRGK
jgi:hypothetical protein